MGMLRDRMIEEMTLRNFAADTQKSYLYAVARLAKFYGRAPDQLSQEEIRSYLLHLINERKLAATTVTTIIAGLRFFYNQTLGWDEQKLFLPPRRKSRPLPEILSPREVTAVIHAARGPKQRLLLMTAYSAGLRVSELINLKVQKIDPELMMIHIELSKDGKGRYTLLSHRLLQELRAYWQRYQSATWLFPNRTQNGPMGRSTAEHIYTQARRRAGLEKGHGIRTLRSCFATHLLQFGTDLRTIQLLMGHSSILSTQRYLRLKQQDLGTTKSPLDLLDL